MSSLYQEVRGAPLFQRAWSLVISKPGATLTEGLQFSSRPTQGQPLRLTFNVQRSLDHKSNKASIVLYNLSQKTIGWIERGFNVFLDVGYGPTVPGKLNRIFLGQVVERATTLQGGDTATELVCGDTEFLLQQAHVEVSANGPNVTLATILTSIVSQLKNITLAGEGVIKGVIMQNVKNPKLYRYADAGPAQLVLQRLLSRRGFDWSLQNGQLQISHKDGNTPTPSTKIDIYSGLIERPTISKKGVKFRSLIQPTIVPGLVASLESKVADISGTFRVCEATYQGDTHGGDWFVDVYGETFTSTTAPYTPPTDQKGKAENAAVPAESDDPELDEDAVDQ